jgi:hypothetical protein
MISVGRRNLLMRLARSRAARDVRSLGESLAMGFIAAACLIGTMVIVEAVIQIGAPWLARMLGWM